MMRQKWGNNPSLMPQECVNNCTLPAIRIARLKPIFIQSEKAAMDFEVARTQAREALNGIGTGGRIAVAYQKWRKIAPMVLETPRTAVLQTV